MKQRAFTLLEALVSGLLIACVILSVAGLFAGSARALRHAGNQQNAALLAEQVLEQARAMPFSRLALGRQNLAPVQLDSVDYQGTQEILSEASAPVQVLKRVRVTINWTYRNQPQQLVRESWLCAIKN